MCTLFTLSHLIGFRDLNFGLGCSPLGTQVYPEPPSPSFYGIEIFGVGQGAEGFLPLNPRSVSLPSQLSPLRLDYGQLRQEPAITELDWLFTPIPKLKEHVHVAPLQASTRFYPHFTLLRNRSPGFGSHSSDCARFHRLDPRYLRSNWFPFEFSFSDYSCHSNALPGTLFQTHDRTPKSPVPL
jgi:hypothetical protein